MMTMSVMIVMVMMPVSLVGHAGITRHIIISPRDQPLEFAAVEPDASARPADIYGDPVTFTFFKSRCIASRADHVHSFHVHKTLRAPHDARSRG